MISRKIGKEDPEWKLLTDWFQYRQKYYTPENDKDIAEATEAGYKLIDSYAGTEAHGIARELVFSHLAECGKRTGKFKVQITFGKE